MRKIILVVLISVLIAATVLLVQRVEHSAVMVFVEQHRIIGAAILAVLMCLTTVVAPLSMLPFVPMLAPLFGPFLTGFASFIGWFSGALIAFWIGRRYGKPFVPKYIPSDQLDRYNAYIKPRMEFITIVLLRLLIPVDVLSYALGIFSNVSFPVYAGATGIGIVWFSFGFAYMGQALFDHHTVLLASISVASVIILCGAWWYLRVYIRK